MQIIPYTIANTNDLLTARGGLVCLAELMRRIGFSAWVERYFPKPGSHRGYSPAEVVCLWMLVLHEGARSLEDVRHIREDKALRELLGWRRLPSADMLGDWLRRLGNKELKSDFAGDRLPCGQFEANALYFHLCVTACNLFVLFRHSLPPEWHTRRGTPALARVTGLTPSTCPSLLQSGMEAGQNLPCQGSS